MGGKGIYMMPPPRFFPHVCQRCGNWIPTQWSATYEHKACEPEAAYAAQRKKREEEDAPVFGVPSGEAFGTPSIFPHEVTRDPDNYSGRGGESGGSGSTSNWDSDSSSSSSSSSSSDSGSSSSDSGGGSSGGSD